MLDRCERKREGEREREREREVAGRDDRCRKQEEGRKICREKKRLTENEAPENEDRNRRNVRRAGWDWKDVLGRSLRRS